MVSATSCLVGGIFGFKDESKGSGKSLLREMRGLNPRCIKLSVLKHLCKCTFSILAPNEPCYFCQMLLYTILDNIDYSIFRGKHAI